MFSFYKKKKKKICPVSYIFFLHICFSFTQNIWLIYFYALALSKIIITIIIILLVLSKRFFLDLLYK